MGNKSRCKYYEPYISQQCIQSDTVYSYNVQSIWIGDGTLAALGSSFTWVTGNSITHWYVVITTEQGRYYCAQFDGQGQLCLTRHQSYSDARAEGKTAVDARYEHKNITIKYSGSPYGRTIRDIKSFIRRQKQVYGLISNNCQDFGTNFHYWC